MTGLFGAIFFIVIIFLSGAAAAAFGEFCAVR